MRSRMLLAEMKLSRAADSSPEERAAHLLGATRGVAERLGLVYPERAERQRASHLRRVLSAQMGAERLAGTEAIGAAWDDDATLEAALSMG